MPVKADLLMSEEEVVSSFSLHRRNRAKIVATLGPATLNKEKITQLILAGVNVFRLNFSHSPSQEMAGRIQMIRQIASELKRPVAILGDLQGPKLRTGPLKNDTPVFLEPGKKVLFTTKARESAEGVIGTKYQAVIDALEVHSTVLIDDGKIRLKVLRRLDDQTVECRVIQGGHLNARKGINLPDSVVALGSMTDKDREDALAATRAQVDYLALSFVQHAENIRELRDFIRSYELEPPPVIAKIEKPQALQKIDEILEEADGLMVARGDLGVELPPEKVPVAQKKLVEKANLAGKPVIIATQMMESMINSLQPARSDVSDVANAVFDGADALMLSGETAMGNYPVETVSMMRRIIQEAEKDYLAYRPRAHEASSATSPHFYHTIAHSASYAATKANVSALVVLSTSGSMAQRVSKLKPLPPIVALTPNESVYNRMSLLWGVTPLVISYAANTDEILKLAEDALLSNQLLKDGDSVVFCAGKTPLRGATNMLQIYQIGQANN